MTSSQLLNFHSFFFHRHQLNSLSKWRNEKVHRNIAAWHAGKTISSKSCRSIVEKIPRLSMEKYEIWVWICYIDIFQIQNKIFLFVFDIDQKVYMILLYCQNNYKFMKKFQFSYEFLRVKKWIFFDCKHQQATFIFNIHKNNWEKS